MYRRDRWFWSSLGFPGTDDPPLLNPAFTRSIIMTIGIIGSGALGSNAARAFTRKGLSVIVSNSRGPASLANLIEELGPNASAGSIAEAASADVVLVAVPWVHIADALRGLPAWNGRIVVDGTNAVEFLDPNSPDANDPTNPLAAYGIKAIDLGNRHSSAVFREFVPGARVVKAFNHLDVRVLVEPETAGGKRVLFYSGDDAAAKSDVRALIETAGFFPIDLGPLDLGGPLASLPFGSLATLNLIKV
jgi:predicted dinucleotide-binding enzyme